jgi:post-segregation antitoxin (ccd killing protein)
MSEPSKNRAEVVDANPAQDSNKALSANERWLKENRATIASWNKWVAIHGMTYDEYRQG